MGGDCDCMYLWHNVELRGEELEGGVCLYVEVVKVDDRRSSDGLRYDVRPVDSYLGGFGDRIVEDGHL